MAKYNINTLRELLEQCEKSYEDKTAFHLKDKASAIYQVSYREFCDDCKALMSYLSSAVKGKKTAIYMPNSYQWCLSFMAVTASGGIAVPVDKDMPSGEVINILSYCDCHRIITDENGCDELKNMDEKMRQSLEIICVGDEGKAGDISFGQALERGRQSKENIIMPSAEDTAAIFFTSGTTGMIKGVMLSHGNFTSDLKAVSSHIRIYEGDMSLSVLPLHHTYELIAFLMVLYSGASISFCQSIRRLKESLAEYKPTVFVAVPVMLEKLHHVIKDKLSQRSKGYGAGLITRVSSVLPPQSRKKLFGDIHSFFGGRLRLIISGGAPLQKETAEDFMTYGIPVIIGYGLTECSPIVICNNDSCPLCDSIGQPLPGVSVRVASPDENGVGEILVRGPMVMQGYYKNEALTREAISEGWFHTGDLGYCDKNGNYYITGRIKNIIVTKNGKNIYPEEVEHYLMKERSVAECLVYQEGTDIITAEILPDIREIEKKLKKAPLTADEIHSAVKEAVRSVNRALVSYKRIKKVVIRKEAFEKTSTQKIKRNGQPG